MNSSISPEAGVDVSGKELVVNLDGHRLGSFRNAPAGLRELHLKLPKVCNVSIEASGGHDRLARHMLSEWGYHVRLLNARKVRRMADGMGFSCKTDDQDALALVEVGPLIVHRPQKDAVQEDLCDRSRTIDRLKDDLSNWKRQTQIPSLPKDCVKVYETLIKKAEGQILLLEKKYIAAVNASRFKTRYELALTVRGIGPVTARILSCELPDDLSAFTTKILSSYAGLAPMDDQSGKRNGPKHIRPGNVHLKSALYMPALNAVGHEDWAKQRYAKVIAQGKTKDQAIVPIMRKIFVRVAAVLIRGTAFTASPPNKNPQTQIEP